MASATGESRARLGPMAGLRSGCGGGAPRAPRAGGVTQPSRHSQVEGRRPSGGRRPAHTGRRMTRPQCARSAPHRAFRMRPVAPPAHPPTREPRAAALCAGGSHVERDPSRLERSRGRAISRERGVSLVLQAGSSIVALLPRDGTLEHCASRGRSLCRRWSARRRASSRMGRGAREDGWPMRRFSSVSAHSSASPLTGVACRWPPFVHSMMLATSGQGEACGRRSGRTPAGCGRRGSGPADVHSHFTRWGRR